MKWILIVLALAGMYYIQSQYRRVATAITQDNTVSCLVMAGNTLREEQSSSYIVGTIRNNCSRAFSNVTVVFKVEGPMDAKFNNHEGIYYAYERDVQPGERREFKTMFPVRKNGVYRFDRITAY